MQQIFRILSILVNIYSVIIFIRLVLTWFSWTGNSGIQGILAGITDPYLNWFRRFSFLKLGFLDLSPVAALCVLTLVNRILGILAFYNRITFGIILSLALQVVWGAVSFFLGFLIIILVLHGISYLAQLRSNFWRIIDTISRPVLFRINRLFFRNRIVNYRAGLFISIAGLVVLYFIIRILVSFASLALTRLPF